MFSKRVVFAIIIYVVKTNETPHTVYIRDTKCFNARPLLYIVKTYRHRLLRTANEIVNSLALIELAPI